MKDIFSNPAVQTTLISLIVAAATFAATWFNKRTAVLKQAAHGAVVEMNALTQPKRELSGPEKKQEAIARVLARIPNADPHKVAQHIEDAYVQEKERPTTPPPPPPPVGGAQ